MKQRNENTFDLAGGKSATRNTGILPDQGAVSDAEHGNGDAIATDQSG